VKVLGGGTDSEKPEKEEHEGTKDMKKCNGS